MEEITDETIKQKHQEFNEHIQLTLKRMRRMGKLGEIFQSQGLQRLRSVMQRGNQ